jgi:DNA repair exonuclease SbcCD ATPase subunit
MRGDDSRSSEPLRHRARRRRLPGVCRAAAAAGYNGDTLTLAFCAQVKQLEQALAAAQSPGQQRDSTADDCVEQLRHAQQQLQSHASALHKLSARREKLKQKNAALKSSLAAAVHDRHTLADELDAVVRARGAAEEVASELRAAVAAAQRERSDADSVASAASARSTACAAEVKSLRLELSQAVEARDSSQSMLSAINERCFELMQQCRHLTQLQRDADTRAEAAELQLASAARDFDARVEECGEQLQQEATRVCEEEAARCKLQLRVHDLEQQLRAAESAAEVCRQQLVLHHRLQLDVEKQQGKLAKQAAELRLSRDEVQVPPACYGSCPRCGVQPSSLRLHPQVTSLRARSSGFDEEIIALRRHVLKVKATPRARARGERF